MRRLLASVPRALQGRPWSDRLPWRFSLWLDGLAEGALYRRSGNTRFQLRSGDAAATFLFGGDLALHRLPNVDPAKSLFQGVQNEFRGADFRVLNLETVLTEGNALSGKIGAFLRAPPEGVEVLEHLGVDAVTSANNHALDFGAQGLADTGRVLRDRDIGWFGVDQGSEESATLVRDVKGLRVGMTAATDHFGGIPSREGPAPVWLDQEWLKAEVQRLRSTCDLVVVHLHWGYEYVMYPLLWHRDLARELVDDGAHVVCCHHAHVPMGVESWGRGVIAYGLGNFYFGLPSRRHPLSRFGLLLRVTADGEGVVSAEVVTVRTDDRGEVGIDAEGCPGFRRLSQGLADDAFLARVEGARVLHELSQLILGIERLVEEGDEEGLRERQTFLSAPRQEWLISRTQEVAPSVWREAGEWLDRFRGLPPEEIGGLESPQFLRGPVLRRRADRRFLVGRLP